MNVWLKNVFAITFRSNNKLHISFFVPNASSKYDSGNHDCFFGGGALMLFVDLFQVAWLFPSETLRQMRRERDGEREGDEDGGVGQWGETWSLLRRFGGKLIQTVEDIDANLLP